MSNQKNLKLIGSQGGMSSHASAFWDGVGTLLDIYPRPRRRSIRAFHGGTYARTQKAAIASVNDVMAADWVAIGQDMWSAIRLHHKECIEEAAKHPELLAPK